MENYQPASIFTEIENNQPSQHRSLSLSPPLPPDFKNKSRSSSYTSCSSSYYNYDEENRNSDEFATYSIRDDSSSLSSSPPSPPSVGLMFKVQFKSTMDNFYLADSCTRDIAIGDYVKVEADRGHDVGTVSDIFWPSTEEVQTLAVTNNKKILAIASKDEYLLSLGKARDEARALSICEEIISARGMRVNLVDAEFQYDRKKLTFFFTSDGHTDFRELVRDLFAIFKTRIWMQKIKPYEAVAFQNANAPIPRFNGGPGAASSAPGARQHHQYQNQNPNHTSPHVYTKNKNKNKSYPSAMENTSTDIYRTQIHVQNKHTAGNHGHLKNKYLGAPYVDHDYHHNNHHNYHQQPQQQGRRVSEQPQYHSAQYNPSARQQQPQFHHLQQQQRQYHQQQEDPFYESYLRQEQQQQGQGQEYTTFSSYASRFGTPGGHGVVGNSSYRQGVSTGR